MPVLHERFPVLRETLPHLPLYEGRTPVRQLRALSEQAGGVPVWVKDDGPRGTLWGGNKPRKLEWTLADALRRGRRTVVTFGALATNHGLATALYAREHGLRAVLVLVDQPVDDHVRRQLERIRRSGARVYLTHGTKRTVAALPWLVLRHMDWRRLRPPYLLPPGGSSPLGAIGFVEAGLELGDQVIAGELPAPSHAVVALGSGGTAAGLMLGLRLAGLRTRVTAVLVNDKLRLDPRFLARLARRSHRLLRRRGAGGLRPLGPLRGPPPGIEAPTERDVNVHDRWLGPGYGHRTPEAEEALQLARDLEGLQLEPVYTAKAMAGLLALAREGALGDGPVLYWHTHSSLPTS